MRKDPLRGINMMSLLGTQQDRSCVLLHSWDTKQLQRPRPIS